MGTLWYLGSDQQGDINTFSKKSSQMISDQIESGGKNCFLFVSVWKAIVKKNQYNHYTLFAEKSDQADLCKYLVWQENNLLRESTGAILETFESRGSNRDL